MYADLNERKADKKNSSNIPNDNSLLFNRKKRVTIWNHAGENMTNTIYKTPPQTIAQEKQYIRKVWQKRRKRGSRMENTSREYSS